MAARVWSYNGKKGGIGKTTCAINTAGCLANRGADVILVDTDIGNDSSTFWASKNKGKYFDVISAADESLKRLIERLRPKHDFIIIDGAPRSDESVSDVIKASDFVGICTKTCDADTHRNSAIAQLVKELDDRFETETVCRWILTQVIRGSNLVQNSVDKIDDYSVNEILAGGTTHCVAYPYAYNEGETVFTARNSISNIKVARSQIERMTDAILELTK